MQRYSIRRTTKNGALAKRNSISNTKILNADSLRGLSVYV